MDFISKLEKRFGSWAVPHLTLYLMAIQAIGVALLLTGYSDFEDLVLALQPAVSPDGKQMAISTVCFEEDAPGRLLLVDLESLETRFIDPPAQESK